MLVAAPLPVRPAAPGPPLAAPALPPIDDAVLRNPNWKVRLVNALSHRPQLSYAVLRRVAPILRVKSFVCVTRDDDVREVLGRDADFPVPFGRNFQAIDPTGTNFVLGMPNSPQYRAIRAATMRVFSLQDVPRIAQIARTRAEAIMAGSCGAIDVVRDLLVRVLLDVTREYYGVDFPLPDGAHWLQAVSFFDFSPVADPAIKKVAFASAERIALVVDHAIARARAGELPGTIVARYVEAQPDNPVLTDEVVRATVTGMIAGFIPTNSITTGHIVDLLLDKPAMMAACQAAARANDDDRLDRCLFEVLRWHPLNPGPFRNCAAETTIAAGTRREARMRPGDLIMVGTGSAMFDPRRVKAPNTFDPDREPSDYLHFGYGQHWCIGFALARAQMTQTIKPLLLHTDIRRASGKAGKLAVYGSFPDHMTILHGPRAR